MMTFKEVQAFVCERYELSATEASSFAKSLFEDRKMIPCCPQVFTPVTLGEYLDRLERDGGAMSEQLDQNTLVFHCIWCGGVAKQEKPFECCESTYVCSNPECAFRFDVTYIVDEEAIDGYRLMMQCNALGE